MEIIFEIFFELLMLVLQFAGELAVELTVQATADAIGKGVRRNVRRGKRAGPVPESVEPVRAARKKIRSGPVDPMLKACAYLAAGWLAGMLSLWLVPNVYIKVQWLRVAGLALLPLATASMMSLLGSWRARHDKQVGGLETFSYGFCFAFMVSLVRFIWGRVV